MKLVTSRGKVIPLKNCRKPKMTVINGRTWDTIETIIINNIEVDIYCDTTWGRKFYLNYNGRWYSGDIWNIDEIHYMEKIELLRGK